MKFLSTSMLGLHYTILETGGLDAVGFTITRHVEVCGIFTHLINWKDIFGHRYIAISVCDYQRY